MGYMPEGSIEVGLKRGNPLVPVVRPLSPEAKKAMYAAAEKGLIVRKTWNGCAFNAAGKIIGKSISATDAAAEAFSVAPGVVDRFIRVWDSLPGSDARCTLLLKEALDYVGICTEANRSRVKKVIRGYAYKSKETAFKEELANIDNVDEIPGVRAMEALLNA